MKHKIFFTRLNELNNDALYGVERIVERRYYVKRPRLVPKCNRLTSTSDLTESGKKIRQLSSFSKETTESTCSRCPSSVPSYRGGLRHRSDLIRNEISELKNEIEQLQISQQEFFRRLQTQLQSKLNSAKASPHLGKYDHSFFFFNLCLFFI